MVSETEDPIIIRGMARPEGPMCVGPDGEMCCEKSDSRAGNWLLSREQQNDDTELT